MRTLRQHHGYTLLELVLVLAVLGAALAIAAPSLSGFGSGRKTDEAAARFVALTRLARSQAIADGMPYRILLDPGSNSYRLQVQEIDEFVDVFNREYFLPEGVTFETNAPAIEGGYYAIEFDQLGRAQPADVVFAGRRGYLIVRSQLPVEEYRVLHPDEAGS